MKMKIPKMKNKDYIFNFFNFSWKLAWQSSGHAGATAVVQFQVVL